MTSPLRRGLATITLASAVLLPTAACGSGSDAADSPSTVATTSLDSGATGQSTTLAQDSPTTTAMDGKVDANNASGDELAAAFTAAGVDNAERWAREVQEYRPYDATDTNWGKLRQELSKYGIADDQLEKIISVLEV